MSKSKISRIIRNIYYSDNCPAGILSASPGSLCINGGGGANISLWIKESGQDAEGWRAVLTTNYADTVTSLPTADASQRGRMIMIKGGTGAEDTVYICKKLINDTYDWFQVI